MLDAAHGEAAGPLVGAQRIDVGGIERQVARPVIAGSGRRRTPIVAVAVGRVGSRRVVAVARSRRSIAIAGMNDGKGTSQ